MNTLSAMSVQAGPGTAARPPVEWAQEGARDRLSSTLFLAGLAHGIIILGVTFSAVAPDAESTVATSLDVVLLARDYEKRNTPENAELLASQNLNGAGNTAEPDRSQAAPYQAQDMAMPADLRQSASDLDRTGDEASDAQSLLLGIAVDPDEQRSDAEGARTASMEPASLPGDELPLDLLNEPAARTLLSSDKPRELFISATTRESRIAAYLSQWKIKVELVGTRNFPRVARNRGTIGHPTLEVAIKSNGDLRDVVVRKSSGQSSLDNAAMQILRNAAPFDPFPDFLRADYDVLRFAYEWRFTDGGEVRNISTVGGS